MYKLGLQYMKDIQWNSNFYTKLDPCHIKYNHFCDSSAVNRSVRRNIHGEEPVRYQSSYEIGILLEFFNSSLGQFSINCSTAPFKGNSSIVFLKLIYSVYQSYHTIRTDPLWKMLSFTLGQHSSSQESKGLQLLRVMN